MRTLCTVLMLSLWVAPVFALQPDSKVLLRDAATRVRSARSFRIEFETTITHSSKYAVGWSKQMYVVASADHKYYWETKGNSQHMIRIDDGTNDWFYRPDVHEYSVRAADPTKQRLPVRGTASGSTESWVSSAIRDLLHVDGDVADSEIEGEEALAIGSIRVPCYVVHAAQSMSFHEGITSTRDRRYWIEKATGLIRKITLSTQGPRSYEEDPVEQTRTVETMYTRVELDKTPDATLFRFNPPTNAYLIDDARVDLSPQVSIGAAAPSLKLNDKDGTLFDLSQLKGKVTLVEFWASWCGACWKEMKALDRLSQSYLENGLVIVCVDEDEIPDLGDTYLSSQTYRWKNLHDVGEIQRKNWGVSAFPYLVLVDREGYVRWVGMGVSTGFTDELRSQLDKPELRLKP